MASRVRDTSSEPPIPPRETERPAAGDVERPGPSLPGGRAEIEPQRAGSKTRRRAGGAAVALDELDRRLLNLMQGSFPLEPQPYAAVARAAEITEEQALTRVRRLLDERIIRQITPIYDTRALGYSSMLVAAKIDPEHPWRAAKIVNSHPGVSHNYLRATMTSTCGSRSPPSPTRGSV